MAAPSSFSCLANVFVVLYFLLACCTCSKDHGSHVDLQGSLYSQENFLDIRRIGGEGFSSGDLSKSLYHIQKRSADISSSPSPPPAPAPPLKKASQNEKKIPTKSPTTDSIDAKSPKSVLSNISSPTNLTEMNVTTQTKKMLKEKYNASLPSPSEPPSTTVGLLTTVASTTRPMTTTAASPAARGIPEVLPTKPANITNATVDHHIYYDSSFFLEEKEAMAFWVNFDEVPEGKVVTHHMLSDSHRRAATVTLSFDFPFYGHPVRNITIATGGFLYMGDYMHSWLAATQYIAPLMANFDTSLSNESTVRYFDNGTAFVIEWNEVSLQDGKHGGNFTFQATLLKNGNIIFVYETIPVAVTEIGDEYHPVKVGLSDAYVIDKVIYFVRRKTIYEYHRIDMKKEEIGNHTAIYFTALTTCLNFHNCSSCMSAEIELECIWCEAAHRCSDGLDRQRQDWLQQRCDIEKSSVNCSALPSGNMNPFVQPFTDSSFRPYTVHPAPGIHDTHPHSSDSHIQPFEPNYHEDNEVISQRVRGEEPSPLGVGGVVAILLILGIVLGAAAWIGYAYRNPHTSSGQLLIRYRPSQWRFRSGEARYTAASVHM